MRRYPALAYLVGAVVLAMLLPSGLTLPNRGPSTLAEYAPVPGQGKGVSPIAGLGQTSSGGIGGNGGGDSTATTDALGGGGGASRLIRKATKTRCVGNPPRQTEDPLSPPCVATFEGDNGGATGKGVTRQEVTVAIANDGNPDNEAGKIVDCAGPSASTDNPSDIFCRAYMNYFNARYQTYNRRVHLYVTHSLQASDVEDRLHPFASVGGGSLKTKTLGINYNGTKRSSQQAIAPFSYTFRPDLEGAAAMMATFVCNKLAGQKANFAGDPLIQAKTRKFAVWMRDDEVYRPILVSALKSTCNLDPMIVGVGGAGDTTAAPARMNQAGITTVFLMIGNTDFAVATSDATQEGFFPEWLVNSKPVSRENDVNFYGRLADQNQWRHAFGITTDYRRDGPHDQWWYRAYKEGCPDCGEPGTTNYSFVTFLYDQMSLLFRAIQAAGPRLSPESADRGMHAIPPNGSPEPYKPAAYFSPGNYSYVKDAMAIWWDPSGVTPGDNTTGCYRLPEDGKRYRAGEWRPGTAELFPLNSSQPCQGNTTVT